MGQLDPHPGYNQRCVRLVRSSGEVMIPANLIERAIGRTWYRDEEKLHVFFTQRGAMGKLHLNHMGTGWALYDQTPRDRLSRTACVTARSWVIVRAWLPPEWAGGYVRARVLGPYTLKVSLRGIREW